MFRKFPKMLSIVTFFIMFLMFFVQRSESAEISVRPAVDIVQEYNDNIFLERKNKNSDYITRFIPSINLSYRAPFWEWQLGYALNWWYYHKLGRSYDSHQLSLNSRLDIIDNFLYFDITDVYSNVPLDERRASNEDNLNENRTDQNIFTASPYIKYRITPVVTLTVGYRYRNLWYREEGGISRQSHAGYATIDRMFSPNLNIAIGAEYTAERPESRVTDNNQTLAFVKAFYTLSARTSFDGSLGYKKIDFSKGNDESSPYYNFKILHRFHEHGEVELGISSEIDATALYGVRESRREQLTIRYGDIFKIIGSVSHQKNEYLEEETAQEVVLEKDLRDDIVGLNVGLEYRPNPLLTFHASGGYQKYSFSFQRRESILLAFKKENEVREVYTLSTGMDYRFTEKITLALTYGHTRENGRTSVEDYRNNIVAVRLRINI